MLEITQIKIFEKILEIAIKNNLIDHSSLFIDSTHIKANANKNKQTLRINLRKVCLRSEVN